MSSRGVQRRWQTGDALELNAQVVGGGRRPCGGSQNAGEFGEPDGAAVPPHGARQIGRRVLVARVQVHVHEVYLGSHEVMVIASEVTQE